MIDCTNKYTVPSHRECANYNIYVKPTEKQKYLQEIIFADRLLWGSWGTQIFQLDIGRGSSYLEPYLVTLRFYETPA